MQQVELCEEKIDEYNSEKEREECREAGITEGQEYAEIQERIKAAQRKIAESKKE